MESVEKASTNIPTPEDVDLAEELDEVNSDDGLETSSPSASDAEESASPRTHTNAPATDDAWRDIAAIPKRISFGSRNHRDRGSVAPLSPPVASS